MQLKRCNPMNKNSQNVAVLGASAKTERYSNKAIKMLLEYGHEVIPVHPALQFIEGLPVAGDLDQIKNRVDTLTVYVSSKVSSSLKEKIIRLTPGRVIFNPGAENQELKKRLEEDEIKCEEACTLVLLRTGQF